MAKITLTIEGDQETLMRIVKDLLPSASEVVVEEPSISKIWYLTAHDHNQLARRPIKTSGTWRKQFATDFAAAVDNHHVSMQIILAITRAVIFREDLEPFKRDGVLLTFGEWAASLRQRKDSVLQIPRIGEVAFYQLTRAFCPEAAP